MFNSEKINLNVTYPDVVTVENTVQFVVKGKCIYVPKNTKYDLTNIPIDERELVFLAISKLHK